jgi:hypothetical protein
LNPHMQQMDVIQQDEELLQRLWSNSSGSCK